MGVLTPAAPEIASLVRIFHGATIVVPVRLVRGVRAELLRFACDIGKRTVRFVAILLKAALQLLLLGESKS